MGKMRRVITALFLFLLLVVIAPSDIHSSEKSTTTIVVPDDYPTIQEALDAASDGDTVLVNEGTYSLQERILVDKTLSLIANGSVIIEAGEQMRGHTLDVGAYDAIVKGFTITRPHPSFPDAGIFLGGMNCTVSGNTITNNCFGIWALTGESTISNNLIADNSIAGLYMDGSVNCTVSGNTFRRNSWGIESEDYPGATSLGNKFYHNNFIDNSVNVKFWHVEEVQEVWDGGYPAGGNYWDNHVSPDCFSGPHQNETLSDGMADDPYVLNEINVDRYPLMKPYPGAQHDVGITYVESRTVVGRDLAEQPVTIALFNYGDLAESLNVTASANGTLVDKVTDFALVARGSAGATLAWNTTGLPMGHYTVRANVSLPNDPDVTDNFYSYWVTITIPGDMNGDFDVDIFDMIWMASGYNLEQGDPRFHSNFDLDDDGDVDIFDIVIAVGHYGEEYIP